MMSHSTGKCNKTDCMGRNLEIRAHTFPIYACFFPIQFPSCDIFHHMRNAWVSPLISHNMGNAKKPILLGEPGKLAIIVYQQYGCSLSIQFPSYGIVHQMGNEGVFSLLSHIRKRHQNPTNGESL